MNQTRLQEDEIEKEAKHGYSPTHTATTVRRYSILLYLLCEIVSFRLLTHVVDEGKKRGIL